MISTYENGGFIMKYNIKGACLTRYVLTNDINGKINLIVKAFIGEEFRYDFIKLERN